MATADEYRKRLADLEELHALRQKAGRKIEPDTPSTGEDVLTGAFKAAQGAMAGFGDELAALGAATFGMLPESMGGSPTSFGETYRGVRENIREREREFTERNPGTAMAAELTGSLLPISRAVKAASRGTGRIPAPESARGRFARQLGAGAATGGAYGLGSSEADLTQGDVAGAAADTAQGATIGLAIPAVTPLVKKAAGSVFNPIAEQFSRRSSRAAETLERRKLAEALEAEALTPQQARQRLLEMGPEATIADLGDQPARLLRGQVAMPGPAQKMAREVYGPRQAAAGERVLREGQRSIEPNKGAMVPQGYQFKDPEGAFYDQLDTLQRGMKERAKGLYDAAYAVDLPMTEKFQSLLQRPSVVKAMRKVVNTAADEGKPIPKGIKIGEGDPMAVPSVEAWDWIKREMDDRINKLYRKGAGGEARRLRELKQEITDEVDFQTGGLYKEARSAWAGDKALETALDEGSDFLKFRNATELKRHFQTLGESEQRMYRMGVMRKIQEEIEKVPDESGSVYKRIFSNPAIRKKIEAVMPSDDAFKQFEAAMKREQRYFDTNKTVDVRMGSQTTPMREDIAGTAVDPGIISNLMQGNIGAAAMGGVRALRGGAAFTPQATRDMLARSLTAQGQDAQQVLRQLENVPPRDRQRLLTALMGTGMAITQ